jgi:hypothetical protein
MEERNYKLIVDVTAAQTKIKEIIYNDVFDDIPESETKRKVMGVIKQFIKRIKDADLARDMAYQLSKAFRYWYVKTKSDYMAIKLGIGELKSEFKFFLSQPVRNIVTTQPIGSPLIEQYKKKVKEAYAEVAAQLSKSNGMLSKGISLRNMAEMHVRNENTKQDIANFKAQGIRLVWVTSHANCSERCRPWQGRLYSLDGTSGVIDGHKYIPIETAINVPQQTKSGKVYMNGLFGFNCRHHMAPYQRNSTPPIEYTEAQIRKERRLDAKQRYMERLIRKHKEEGFICRKTNYKKSLKQWKIARKLEANYEEWCKQNDRVIYRERLKVMTEEFEHLYDSMERYA